MSEKTLNDPLSGEEIIEIVLQEIEKRLRGDCTLQNDLTYAGFRLKFDIAIEFSRSLTKSTVVWGNAERAGEGESAPAGAAAVAGDHESAAPNVERQAHDLPIPVMVSTPAGMERRKVKIERAGKK